MATEQSHVKKGSGFALTLALALVAFLSQRFWYVHTGYQASVLSDLGPKLSPNATILLPDDPNFAAATRRWVEYQAPSFDAVVVVTSEEDVQQTAGSPVPCSQQHNRLTR